MSTTIKNPRATKKFKALLAVLNDEDMAVTAWNDAHPDNRIAVEGEVKVSAEVAKLVEAGFTKEQAVAALAAASKTDTSAAPEPEEPLTSHEQGEVLAAKAGLVPVRGRVYASAGLIEAQARVLRSGKPELVQSPGEHRTKGVLVYRMDDAKTIALQNYGVQN